MSDTTLYHGDCIEIMKSLPTNSVNAVVTDPPYGVMNEDSLSNAYQTKAQTWDEASAEFHLQWLSEAKRVLGESGGIFSFISPMRIEQLTIPFKQVFRLQNIIVWNYRNNNKPCFTDDRLKMTWEAILYGFQKKGPPIRKHVMADVWTFAQPQTNYRDKRVHPAQKPLALMLQLISVGTPEGGTVLDCFMGSGTTGVACVQTGRNFIGIEKDNGYYGIAEERIAMAKTALTTEAADD